MYDYARFIETMRIIADGGDGPLPKLLELAEQGVARRFKERDLGDVKWSRTMPPETGEILRESWIEAARTYFPIEQHESQVAIANMIFDMIAIDGGGSVPASYVTQ